MRSARPVSWTALAAALVVAAAAPAIAQAPPSTDVWLLPLDPATGAPAGPPVNATDRDGYDNQPAFEEAGTLLYTSSRDDQTDIFRLDPASGAAQRVTATPESEYSPTPIPWRQEISVVRVEADGRQRLWSFGAAGTDTDPTLLLEDVEPVGYHAWQADGSLVLFVLGEPATLQLVAAGDGNARVVAQDVGRSLQPIPGSGRFSFLHRGDDGAWRIRSLDPASGEIGELGAAVQDSQDLAWTADGRMLMASGSKVWTRRPEDAEWTLLADLADTGVSGITRLATSADGRWLALVAER